MIKGECFFCTRDLSPTAFGRLQQAYSYITNTARSSSISATLLGSYSIYAGNYKIGTALILGAGAAYVSYSFFDGLLQDVQRFTESIRNTTSSASSWSNPHMNYVPIKRTSFNDINQQIESYKHCSILTAKYKSTEYDNLLAMGSSEVKSFVQDAHNSNTVLEKAGYQAPAIVLSEGLEPGTVCTLVKSFPPKDFITMKSKMDEFFYQKEEKTKYDVISNNCCTVAYDYIIDIDGDTTVIDKSTFNYGVGIKHRSILSFFVGTENHLKDLEKNIEKQDSDSRKKEQNAENLLPKEDKGRVLLDYLEHERKTNKNKDTDPEFLKEINKLNREKKFWIHWYGSVIEITEITDEIAEKVLNIRTDL